MSHLTYLLVLLAIFVGSGWLEVVLGVRVWRRPMRLLLTLLPVVCVFYVWDVYAVSRHHWSFDPSRVTGLRLPGDLPGGRSSRAARGEHEGQPRGGQRAPSSHAGSLRPARCRIRRAV